MSALNQSCNVDSNAPRKPQEPLRPADSRHAPATAQQARAKRSAPRRRPQASKTKEDKRLCSSTIEESSSSANGATSQRKRVRCCKEPIPSTSIIHIQTAIALHLHFNIYTFHSHGSSSHRTVHHERATFHCSVTRSLRLETDGKFESGQLSSAWSQLNAQGLSDTLESVSEKRKIQGQPHTRERLNERWRSSPTPLTDGSTKLETQSRVARTPRRGPSRTCVSRTPLPHQQLCTPWHCWSHAKRLNTRHHGTFLRSAGNHERP